MGQRVATVLLKALGDTENICVGLPCRTHSVACILERDILQDCASAFTWVCLHQDNEDLEDFIHAMNDGLRKESQRTGI